MDPVADLPAPQHLISLSDLVDADADMGSLDELLKYGLDGPTVAEMTMPWDCPDFRSGEEAEDKDVEHMDMAQTYSGQRRPRDVEESIPNEVLGRKIAVKARVSMAAPKAVSHLEQGATKREGMTPSEKIGEFEAWTELQSNLKEKVLQEITSLILESGRDKVRKLTETAEQILRRLSPLPNVPEKKADGSHLPALEESLRILFEKQKTLLSSAHGGQDLAAILGALSQSIKEGCKLVDKLGNLLVVISKKLRPLVQGLKSREDNMDKLLLKCSSNIPALVETFLEQQKTNFISVASEPEDRPQERQAASPVVLQTTETTNDSLRRKSVVALERKFGNWDGYDYMPFTGAFNHTSRGRGKPINPNNSAEIPTTVRDSSLRVDGAGGAPRRHDPDEGSSARTDHQERQHQWHPERPATPCRNDKFCASDAQDPCPGDSFSPGKKMNTARNDEGGTMLDETPGISSYPATGQTWKHRWRCWFRVNLFPGRRKERWVVSSPEQGTMSAPDSVQRFHDSWP